LVRVSGGKNETAKAERDLLDYSKSLAKALKTGLGSDKKVKALELANALLKNDLAVARSKLKDAAKENNSNRKQIDNQLDAKHQLRLSLAKIDLKKHKLTLSRELEKKRKRDDIHYHRLAEIAAREASSKRVKETAASHKTRVKEKALETSTQRVQTMLKTYQGTNSGQFPSGRTDLENVSSRTANLPVKEHCQLTLLFFYDGCE
jgi:chromosome segregation ATPase